MADIKLLVQIHADSILPRDIITNVLHFRSETPVVDHEQLCEDLAAIYSSQWNTVALREVSVRAYEVGPPPQYPKAEFRQNVGLAPQSQCPREVALCLSFYSEHNVPRQRGRVYLPWCLRGTAANVRPDAGALTGVMAMGAAFAALGGPDIDWCIWSPTDNTMRPVTNYWCDNEWDTVRSRGLRATTRQIATTTEA